MFPFLLLSVAVGMRLEVRLYWHGVRRKPAMYSHEAGRTLTHPPGLLCVPPTLMTQFHSILLIWCL